MRPEMKPINIEAYQKVHHALGLALWHIQAFEFSLSHYICLILKLPPSRAEVETLEVLDELKKKTLGQLVTELRKANSTTSVSEFERRVNQFLKERNWLVHASWRENHGVVFSPERMPPLLERLSKLAKESLALQQFFGSLADGWIKTQGVTEEQLMEKTKEVFRSNKVL